MIFSCINSSNNWLRQYRFVAVILLLLIVITPVLYTDKLAFNVFSVKFFWLFFLSIGLTPIVIFKIIQVKRFSFVEFLVLLWILFLMIRAFQQDGHFEENRKLLMIVCSAMVYFSVNYFKKVYEFRNNILTLLVVGLFCCAVVVSIVGLLQLLSIIPSLNAIFNISSTFFHPSPFSGYIASIFPLACLLFWALNKHRSITKYSKLIRILSCITILLAMVILPFTFSRSSILGLLIGIGVILIFYTNLLEVSYNYFPSYIKRLTLALGMVCFLVVSWFAYSQKKESVHGRFLVWKIASQMIYDKPVFGHGINNFQTNYPDYQIAYFKSGQGTDQDKYRSYEVNTSFNFIIQILVEQGIIGFVLFFLILIYLFKSPVQAINIKKSKIPIDQLINIGARGSMVSFLTYSFFTYSFSLTELVLLFFILISLSEGSKSIVPTVFNLQYKSVGSFVSRSILFLILFFIIATVPRQLSQVRAYNLWHKAKILSVEHDDHKSANEIYQLLVKDLYSNRKFRFHYAQNLAELGLYESSINVLEGGFHKTYDQLILLANNYKAIGYTESAEENYKLASNLLPHKFYPIYELMKLANKKKNYDRVLCLANELKSKKIKVHSKEIAQMQLDASILIRDIKLRSN